MRIRIPVALALTSVLWWACAGDGRPADDQAGATDAVADPEAEAGASDGGALGAGGAADDTPDGDEVSGGAAADDGAAGQAGVSNGEGPPDGRIEALDVTVRSLDGGTVDLGSFSGQPVALWMWAPW